MATTLPNTGAIIPAMTEPADQAVNNAAFTAIDAKTALIDAAIGALSGADAALASGTNLNTVVTTGLKRLTGGSTYSNAPAGMTWGLLFVFRSGTYCAQLAFAGNGICHSRTASSAHLTPSWSQWWAAS